MKGPLLAKGIYLLPIVCLASSICFRADAQSDLTSVSGTIHDPSGAVIANAKVTITNQASRAERKAITNSSGAYSIPSVPAGTYTLIVEAAGFKRFEQSGNNFQTSVAATLDATLTLGSASETVQVSSQAPPVQADSATLVGDVTRRQIKDLQLNGRNPYLLALLEPGVTGGTIGGFSFGLNNGLNVDGARNQDTLITQDGAVAVRTRSNGTSIGVADADSTEEVQILTANYNAEYGRASGGQIRIVTKSGTRDFHGTAYEYFRNSALDANSWSRNSDPNPTINSKPAPFRFNQFGYNIGGPIFVPNHWNRDRNRLFFLFGQEFIRYRQDQQNNLTNSQFVPTTLFRQGNFSELLNPRNIFYGRSIQLRDPTTGASIPNNVIPVSELSPNGLALLNIFPAPNTSGALNYLQTAPGPQNQRKDTGAVDYYPADNHYIRVRLLNYSFFQVIPFASNYLVIPQTFDRPNQTISVNYIWNIRPTLVNEFLATASRDQVFINIDRSNGLFDRTRYGINYPYLFPEGKNIPNKIPTVDLNGPFNELSGLPYPSSSKGPIYDLSDNITKIEGNHTIKGGFLFERSGENDFDQINVQGVPGGTNNQNGRFVFLDSTPGGTGLALANAAIGRFDTYAELGDRSYTPYRGFLYEWFAQDSWKVTPKLHLDYGLRQSIITPYFSLWRNEAVFDPRFYNPATAVRVDPSTGRPIPNSGDPYDGLVIPGSGFTAAAAGRVAADNGQFNGLFRPGVSKYYAAIHPLQGLQPRLGIAYAFNEKTVVRAGAGRFLTRLGVSDSVFLGGNPPFQPSASVSFGSVDNPGGGAQNTFPLPVTTEDPVFKNPEAWTWNAAVQRDVGFHTSVEIAYVGRRGLHGQQELNLNQLQPGTTFANPNVNPDALRPYQGYGAIRSTNNVSNSFYNGLQVNVNRRFSSGLLFGLAYTFSKSTDFGSSQRDVLPNAFDRSLQYGPSDYDHRHVAVINVIYELPFYRDTKTLAGKLLGGWQVTEVTQFQTGSPVSVQTNDDFAGVGPGSGNSGDANDGFGSRYIVSGKIAQPGQFGANAQYYAFQPGVNILQPAPGTFTTQRSRNLFYQPGFQNWNFGLFKDFHTTETQFVTLRWEVFNWLNHPNWGGANGGGLDVNPNDANFGRITFKDSQRQLQLSLRYTF
jgi:Carboxypeptidase regulatory-like domain/TonB-dependent Receptor Plug Domain